MQAQPELTSFRPAVEGDLPRLTEIAFAAKAHWGYPSEWLELWRDELEVTAEQLRDRQVRCAELDGVVVGFTAVTIADGGADLESLWVDPSAMGRGLGTELAGLAIDLARSGGARWLTIVADPNARGFYENLGAKQTGTTPSVPKGRELPTLMLDVDGPRTATLCFNAAINRRDLDGLMSRVAEDHVFVDAGGKKVDGAESARAAWSRFFDAFSTYGNEFRAIVERDDHVIAIGRSRSSDPALDGAAIWRADVRDGALTRWQVFEDTPAARASLELPVE